MAEIYYGLVLMGGKSSRMGEDKALIQFHNKPQREYLYELLDTVCERVFVSCKEKRGIPASLNPLEDSYSLNSPLNGILTALEHMPQAHWIVVAVDMPQVDKTTLVFLKNSHDPEKMATCFLDSEGLKPEPLLSIWSSKSRFSVKAFYETGGVSPRKYLMSHPITVLQVPDPKILANINSPAERKAWEENRDNN